MLADNLFGTITLDPLCAGIPAEDAPVSVEHVNGIIRHTLHQQSKLLLGPTELVFRTFAFREISGDLGKADQGSLIRAYGVDDHMRPKP